MKKVMQSLILLGLLPIFLGTTYVVKEGDLEVGKLTVHDGQDKVEIFQGDKSVTAPVKATPDKRSTHETGKNLKKKTERN